MKNEFFRGYVPTNNKRCTMKFKDSPLLGYDEVKNLPEFAGILANDAVLVDFDDKNHAEIALKIVEALEMRCRVVETTRGYHFFFKNKNSKINKSYTGTKIACGLSCDIKCGAKNSYAICKFNGKERAVIYDKFDDEVYQEVPNVFLPVRTNTEIMNLKEGDGRNTVLFSYILSLQENEFTKEEKKAYLAGIKGVALGSDAFFPFGDNIIRAAKSGVSYVAQPGGSIRDDNVIEECNKRGIAMAMTGMRLFHH